MGWADEPADTDRLRDTYWHDERGVPHIAGRLFVVTAAVGSLVRRSSAAVRRSGSRALHLVQGKRSRPCAGATGACLLAGQGNLIIHPPHGPVISRRRRRRGGNPADPHDRVRCRGWSGARCALLPHRAGSSSG
ncbi:hypothetical protein [Pseudonocardia sp. NPDC049635]|uniref:hypothetical protein n=1 Tax=Pseudonocardia sp. NPDC049635 TaxID=3155506 RepID=UPI003401E83E